MKQGIHPQTYTTKVHCNSCDTKFELISTVPDITVEVCSNCHPYYTGKQKLLDTAGRVDKFKARQAEATKRAGIKAAAKNSKDAKIAEIQEEIESETVTGSTES
jgi:large subunit ribosomal protein L31